ncbi:MAG TPA: metalloregulator ArsR/SmtB family transcription factor [bacterium]|nr:metalloregulator ArsR/SmtB family transcription factor [bacterium]
MNELNLHSIEPGTFEDIQDHVSDDEVISALSNLFKALCDPTRLRIVLALQHSELCVHDLANLIRSSESNTSHQLRILRAEKIVKYRKEGKQVFYSIADHHITHVITDIQEHLRES